MAKWLGFYVELRVETAMIFLSEKLKDDCMTEKLSVITWNAEGIPRLKTGRVLFFVGSRKCAYPTDIDLRSGEITIISSSISGLPCERAR